MLYWRREASGRVGVYSIETVVPMAHCTGETTLGVHLPAGTTAHLGSACSLVRDHLQNSACKATGARWGFDSARNDTHVWSPRSSRTNSSEETSITDRTYLGHFEDYTLVLRSGNCYAVAKPRSLAIAERVRRRTPLTRCARSLATNTAC